MEPKNSIALDKSEKLGIFSYFVAILDDHHMLQGNFFTCNLGVRIPTHSGKLPTHFKHFTQMG